jgi:hypothetical protein
VGGGDGPDERGFVSWQGKEGDRTGGEEALVGCAEGVRRGGGVEGEGGNEAVLGVVPAWRGDVGELADGRVGAVCADEEAGGEGAVVGEGDDGPLGEVEGGLV